MKKEKKEKEVKEVKKAKEVKEESKNKQSFFHGIKMEMKKVKWPSAKEIAKYTIATIVVCLIIAGFFQLLNVLISLIKGAF